MLRVDKKAVEDKGRFVALNIRVADVIGQHIKIYGEHGWVIWQDKRFDLIVYCSMFGQCFCWV